MLKNKQNPDWCGIIFSFFEEISYSIQFINSTELFYHRFSFPSTERFLRPFFRRLAIIRRPDGVCIRARNPCVRSRFLQRRFAIMSFQKIKARVL